MVMMSSVTTPDAVIGPAGRARLGLYLAHVVSFASFRFETKFGVLICRTLVIFPGTWLRCFWSSSYGPVVDEFMTWGMLRLMRQGRAESAFLADGTLTSRVPDP